jgi:D-beta-D-heptose 7-phosphate kinase / D-beta-D-heptose 1-phosphate adenosyltransferase
MNIQERLAAFADTRVLLVGDTIVDVYTHGSAIGLAAETPTIVMRREREERTLGGAAFVCRNLLELGAQVDFITLVGRDAEASLVRGLSAARLNLIAIKDPSRPTTVKQRFWVNDHKLLQVDVRDDAPIGEGIAAEVMAAVGACMAEADVLLVADYRHGMIPPALARWLVQTGRAAGKPVYVDSQVAQNTANHTDYGAGAIMCLNMKEALSLDADFVPLRDPAAFARLQAALGFDKLIVKLGEFGALMFDGQAVHGAPARAVTVIDTTGAGDAFLAALVLNGVDNPHQALTLANAWAGLSTELIGTKTPKLKALVAALGTSDERA